VIRFYYNLAPNPMKVALAMEEMGLAYDPIPVDGRKGEQFAPDFLKVNPNGKVPAIVDGDTTVFDSNAIVLYLGEKTGQFMGKPSQKGELLSWLMFVATGVSPFSGQCVHFRHFAPEPKEYAVRRYLFEAERHYGVLEERLAGRAYLLGADYTVADMALWGWARLVPFVIGEGAWAKFPQVKRWFDSVSARPAAARAEALKGRHSFKAEMDEEAKRHMFRFLAPAA
jgi:GST-like protein